MIFYACNGRISIPRPARTIGVLEILDKSAAEKPSGFALIGRRALAVIIGKASAL
jgi:hypothetical protein